MSVTNRIRILTAAAAAVAAIAGCSSVSSPQALSKAKPTGSIVLWSEAGEHEQLLDSAVSQFDAANPGMRMLVRLYENDPYKQKLLTGLRGPQAPDIFYNWGGGSLESLVSKGEVADLSGAYSADSSLRSKYIPSVLKTVTFNGKIYGVPMLSMQPVVFFYNKAVFARVGARPPRTLNDLFALVTKFRAAGITPIALAGQQPWTELTWLEYLTDRAGGPQLFDEIEQGKTGAWRDPAILYSAQVIQRLVTAGAFSKNFSGLSYDNGDSVAQLDSGKAAMELMGTWEFPFLLSVDPSLISRGQLGWFPFPEVPGGKGNVADVVGNPSNFYSVRASTRQPAAATDYLESFVMNKGYSSWLLQHGEVPPLTGIARSLPQSKYPDYETFVYRLCAQAPNFQLSWDQALAPAEAQVMLDALSRLFTEKITPAEFTMEAGATS